MFYVLKKLKIIINLKKTSLLLYTRSSKGRESRSLDRVASFVSSSSTFISSVFSSMSCNPTKKRFTTSLVKWKQYTLKSRIYSSMLLSFILCQVIKYQPSLILYLIHHILFPITKPTRSKFLVKEALRFDYGRKWWLIASLVIWIMNITVFCPIVKRKVQPEIEKIVQLQWAINQ